MKTIEILAREIGDKLKNHGFSLVLAESCTGGGIAYAITHIEGSSQWFDRGFVTYSNEAKQQMLGVSAQLLAAHGAVSEEVAVAMAQGALATCQADVSLAITGIAGPTGGSEEKPVGTVWLAIANRHAMVQTQLLSLQGDRARIREKSILMALEKLSASL